MTTTTTNTTANDSSENAGFFGFVMPKQCFTSFRYPARGFENKVVAQISSTTEKGLSLASAMTVIKGRVFHGSKHVAVFTRLLQASVITKRERQYLNASVIFYRDFGKATLTSGTSASKKSYLDVKSAPRANFLRPTVTDNVTEESQLVTDNPSKKSRRGGPK